MAKAKILFISDCIGNDGFHHRKGTVLELDDQKKSDVPLLAALKAAARIVPPTKENLERCKAELAKKKVELKLTAEEEKAAITHLDDELEAIAKDAESGKKEKK